MVCVCRAMRNVAPPRVMPIARRQNRPRMKLTMKTGTADQLIVIGTGGLRTNAPKARVITTAKEATMILETARPITYTSNEMGEMYTYRIVWYHSRSDWITWNVPNSVEPTKMKNAFPTYMKSNSGCGRTFPIAAKTTYMRTRMKTAAIGLTIE